jgi:uncharacterized protein (TIGR00730 family)
MKNIAVFCGSSEGYDESYREMAYTLGSMLADKGIGLIYGGGRIGLMGAVADGALSNGGRVTGVIPGFLQTKEIGHEGLTEMIVVDTMHQRKLKMNDLCDGVITLPGGWGTMEEFFEMLTWGQLGLHTKPIGVLNINGYYDSLSALCNIMVQEGFLQECTRNMLLISQSIDELLDMMYNYTPPELPKYIDKQTT